MGEHQFRRTRATGRRARLAVAVALVPLLSACDVWEQVGRGPGNTRFNPDETAITPRNVGSLTEAWSIDGGFSEPLLSGDRLYTTAGTPEGASVRAYNAGTGALVWDTPLPAPENFPGGALPVALAGGVLWASYSGNGPSYCSSPLTRLDPATGDILETETTPGLTGPVVADGTTIAFTIGGACSQTGGVPQLVVRDPSTPTGSWTYGFPEGVHPSPPSIGAGRIVVAALGHVYAFDAAGCGAATCEPTWNALLNPTGSNLAAQGRPVVGGDGTVYVSAASNTAENLVLALDAETGAHLWWTDLRPRPADGWQQLALANDTLYVSDDRDGGAVDAFAAEGCGQSECAPVWSASVDGQPIGGLTVGGDVLYVGERHWNDNRFLAFDARGCGASVCTRLADIGFGEPMPMSAAVAGGRVAVVGSGNSGSTLRVLVPTA